MLVLLGYFIIAVGAGVAASGVIGHFLASLLIRLYEKTDRPIKIPTTNATLNQPISYVPGAIQIDQKNNKKLEYKAA